MPDVCALSCPFVCTAYVGLELDMCQMETEPTVDYSSLAARSFQGLLSSNPSLAVIVGFTDQGKWTTKRKVVDGPAPTDRPRSSRGP
jgi:hypothetical protein